MTKNELRKQWSDRIAAYKASGLTQAAFCEAQGVSTRQLSYWLRKETMQQISPEKTTRWLPVKLIDQGSTSGDNYYISNWGLQLLKYDLVSIKNFC